jgi:HEAT repeat protein
MSRISPPTGDSLSAEELRRRRDAEEAFERRCARAAKRLERIADPDVLVARLRDFEDLDGGMIVAIERALAGMADATLRRTERYLATETYDVALCVTSALMRIGPPAVDPLRQIVRSSAAGEARRWACRALGAIGDERAVPVLLHALGDESPDVRAAAAEAFERLPHERAIDRLRALLRDVDVVRSAAARTLHRRWVPSLDLEEDVLRALAADRFSATGAAKRLPPAAKPLLVRFARTGDLVARERSLRALGHRRGNNDVLMEALISPHVELRRAATTALAQICATALEDDAADIPDEEWRRLWRLDEVSPPTATFPCVALPLRAGEVVRLTDERGERWAGEWNEVIVTDEELAGVRGIMDEFDTIAIEELLARGRRHPDPRRWKARAADWRREMAARRY